MLNFYLNEKSEKRNKKSSLKQKVKSQYQIERIQLDKEVKNVPQKQDRKLPHEPFVSCFLMMNFFQAQQYLNISHLSMDIGLFSNCESHFQITVSVTDFLLSEQENTLTKFILLTKTGSFVLQLSDPVIMNTNTLVASQVYWWANFVQRKDTMALQLLSENWVMLKQQMGLYFNNQDIKDLRQRVHYKCDVYMDVQYSLSELYATNNIIQNKQQIDKVLQQYTFDKFQEQFKQSYKVTETDPDVNLEELKESSFRKAWRKQPKAIVCKLFQIFYGIFIMLILMILTQKIAASGSGDVSFGWGNIVILLVFLFGLILASFQSQRQASILIVFLTVFIALIFIGIVSLIPKDNQIINQSDFIYTDFSQEIKRGAFLFTIMIFAIIAVVFFVVDEIHQERKAIFYDFRAEYQNESEL